MGTASQRMQESEEVKPERRGSKILQNLDVGIQRLRSSFSVIRGESKDNASSAQSSAKVHEEQLQMGREKIDVQDLEEYGVEPRYARHLMHKCKEYSDSQ